ncbi:MAG: DNA gyrase/topoisomerase IV subunit A, partial [Flavobacteriales bacterium]
IEQKELGSSTLDARDIWFDPSVFRINTEERGEYLGKFGGKDRILILSRTGQYQLLGHDLNTHFPEDLLHIEKWDPGLTLSVVHFDGEKKEYRIKRFKAEEVAKATTVTTDHPDSFVLFVTSKESPVIKVNYDGRSTDREPDTYAIEELIDLKGIKAKGNLFSRDPINKIELIDYRERSMTSGDGTTEEGDEGGGADAEEDPKKEDDEEGPEDDQEQMRLDLG